MSRIVFDRTGFRGPAHLLLAQVAPSLQGGSEPAEGGPSGIGRWLSYAVAKAVAGIRSKFSSHLRASALEWNRHVVHAGSHWSVAGGRPGRAAVAVDAGPRQARGSVWRHLSHH